MKNEQERVAQMWEEEHRLMAEGYHLIAGVDEAGRGPLAGPVYAAAVILPADIVIEGINDSKKLSEKKRDALYDEIKEKALCYAVASVDEHMIDEINILEATFLAMKQAVASLTIQPDYVLIDGNQSKGMILPHETLVKGDARSISIAAASILAKVERDRYLLKLSEQYPQYGFEKHKGYGTKAHYEAIEQYGISPVHRRSFLKKVLGESR